MHIIQQPAAAVSKQKAVYEKRGRLPGCVYLSMTGCISSVTVIYVRMMHAYSGKSRGKKVLK